MISARGVTRMPVVAAVVMLAVGGAAFGQTHAPWPTNWNNWNDPALWVTVGNPDNAGKWYGHNYGGSGTDRICGAVGYFYNIGKYEVTAGQYTPFLNAVAKTDTYGLYSTSMDTAVESHGCNIKRAGSSGDYTYSVASDWANRPVNNVSWGDAARFANWLTNGQPTGAQNASTTEDGSYYLNGATSAGALIAVTRKTVPQGGRYYIPTQNEWHKAAYYDANKPGGAGYWDYATSSNTTPGRDMADASGNNANYYTGTGLMNPIDSGKYTTVAGEFQNSDSHYGTFDQSGNVFEWNETTPYQSNRGLRGGPFDYNANELHARNWGYTDPTNQNDHLGFRVAEVPDPATISLLALGGAALVARRRGRKLRPVSRAFPPAKRGLASAFRPRWRREHPLAPCSSSSPPGRTIEPSAAVGISAPDARLGELADEEGKGFRRAYPDLKGRG